VHARRIATRLRVAARGTSYRELAEFLRAATGDARWSHVKLRRFEQGEQRLAAAELAQLDRALDTPPVGWKRDRRLEKGLDDAREIVNARDPWVHHSREAALYVEARDGMTSAERKQAWRTVDQRYRECGQRDADGRPTDPDHLLTLDQALYRLNHPLTTPYVVAEPNEVTHRKRFVQRRIDDQRVDDEPQSANPRARVVLEQLRALRTSASAVVELPFLELARAARWAHTVEHATAEAPVWAEHRRRAYEELRRRAVVTLCQQIAKAARVAGQTRPQRSRGLYTRRVTRRPR